ncbi:MAG: TRAP transporter large permease [Thermodesulfobacteriota bacterium]
MSEITVGVIGIVVLLFLFLLRVPVAFSMAIVGFTGFIYLTNPQAGFSVLARDIFEQFSSYSLSCIPMFILMGCIAFASGISKRLYNTTYAWMGHVRGGLIMATVIACAGFGAICGSSAATAATMGKIAIPEMKRYRYDDTLATGAVASAGTLGIMIPPSTVFLVYGILTEQSIGKLFIAGVLPGLLLAFLMMITVAILCWRNPHIAPPGEPTSWTGRFKSLTGVIETLILFLFVIGGLFLGWFSPTQAGGIGAGGTLLIGLFKRELNWRGFFSAAKDALQTSCMVIFCVTGATVFGHFMAVSRITFDLADWVAGLAFPPMVIMGAIVFFYFLGGTFMDSMGLIVLTIPIFYPIVERLGFDPIWFGVVVVLIAEMGVISPPEGVNVFVIKSIAPEVPLQKIFLGVLPFLAAMIVCAVIIMIFPIIATFLPSLITY